MNENEIKDAYVNLLIEQDNQSPHKYLSTLFNPDSNDTFFDIGAAEGILALDLVDICKKVFIVESETKWIEPLQETFAPYKDKVTIINKYAGNTDDNVSINLGNYIKNQCDDIVYFAFKMDIEGYEKTVLNSIKYVLENKKVKMACCTYHRKNDYADISAYFHSLTSNYTLSASQKWFVTDFIDEFSFRKGVLYANNNQNLR